VERVTLPPLFWAKLASLALGLGSVPVTNQDLGFTRDSRYTDPRFADRRFDFSLAPTLTSHSV
jgi:hypothetical protein